MFHVGSAFAGRPLVEDLGAVAGSRHFRAQARDGSDRYLVLCPRPEKSRLVQLRLGWSLSMETASLATIEDIVDGDDAVAILSEWPAYGSLSERYGRHRPVPSAEARTIVEPILLAVTRMHDAGLAHGAIQPQTVRFRNDAAESATLCGFGGEDTAATIRQDVQAATVLLDWLVRDPKTGERPDELVELLVRGLIHDDLKTIADFHAELMALDLPEPEALDHHVVVADVRERSDDDWLEDSASLLSATAGEWAEPPPVEPAPPPPPPLSANLVHQLREHTLAPVTLEVEDEEEPEDIHLPRIAILALATAVAGISLMGWQFMGQRGPTPVHDLPDPTGWPRYSMSLVPRSQAALGSLGSEPGRASNEDRVSVALRGFMLGAHEVTVRQWKEVMDEPLVHLGEPAVDGALQPCADYGVNDNMPVTCVTWTDAIRFANALSARHGFEPAYTLTDAGVRWDPLATGYRLPTEAEWEAAARGGSEAPYGIWGAQGICRSGAFASMQRLAKFPHLRPSSPIPCAEARAGHAMVGAHEPNANRIHDLHGNVSEWTWDLAGGTHVRTVTEYAPATGARVVRGSSWASDLRDARLSRRRSAEPDTRSYLVGFRLARGTR